jgi:hypothetical protein
MKQIVWKYGLGSSAVLVVLMTVMMWLCFGGTVDFGLSEVLGYTSMVLSFVLVFFGIRAYRDEVMGGGITFGKAFKVGLLMTLITCGVYVLVWEIVYWGFYPTFLDDYGALHLERLRDAGETEAAIAEARAQMAKFAELYKNPAINAAITFLEVFPVGLVATLVSAGILRRRTPPVFAAATAAG